VGSQSSSAVLLVSEESAPAGLAHELSEIASEAARMAGQLLNEHFQAGHADAVRSKSTPTDLVSEADLESERAIRELLSQRRPEDGFLGEEGSEQAGQSGLRWVVDPLDGTVNFLFGIPQWCVSVAVEDKAGQTLAGAIFDPSRDEMFIAWLDGRVMLNGEPIGRPTRPGELSVAMVATGLAYDADVRARQAEVLLRLIPKVRDIRRFGSAALDLAWTAVGRYDAYFERSVKPWDIAAGVLICRCAGLHSAELRATEDLPWGVMVTPPALEAALLELDL
jgi:myo-inositol-1(or 4)-monophosphatase